MSVVQTPGALAPSHRHACDICGRDNEGTLPIPTWHVYRGLLLCDLDSCIESADSRADEVSGAFMPLAADLSEVDR